MDILLQHLRVPGVSLGQPGGAGRFRADTLDTAAHDGLLDGLIRHPMRVTLTDERRAARAVGRLRLEFDRLDRAGQSALLISEENLLGTMMNNIEDRGLYPFLLDRMARYAPAFDLRVGLGIRDYADYWASCLGFAIGRGHPAPDRALLDCLVTQPRRWRHLVREIATVFPAARITVWTHEAMAGRARDVTAALWGQRAGRADRPARPAQSRPRL